MTSMSIAVADRVLRAWDGQVLFDDADSATPASAPLPAVAESMRRKHPRLALGPGGTVLLVWTEGTSWGARRGSGVAGCAPFAVLAAKFSGTPREISHQPDRSSSAHVRKRRVGQTRAAWPVSCSRIERVQTVLRAAALSIVLIMAGGPSAALLCSSCCHPQAAVAAACDHAAPVGRSVAAGDACGDLAVGAPVFLKEDVRSMSVPDQQGAAVFPGQHTIAALFVIVGPRVGTGPHRPPENRPLSTVLRI